MRILRTDRAGIRPRNRHHRARPASDRAKSHPAFQPPASGALRRADPASPQTSKAAGLLQHRPKPHPHDRMVVNDQNPRHSAPLATRSGKDGSFNRCYALRAFLATRKRTDDRSDLEGREKLPAPRRPQAPSGLRAGLRGLGEALFRARCYWLPQSLSRKGEGQTGPRFLRTGDDLKTE